MIAAPVIAYRGLSSLLPENTLIAVKGADKIGATWVDLDVRVLNDGTAIIFHDDEVQRTTDGEGVLNSYSSQSIKKLSAGAWFNEKFIEERIPLFSEMLELIDELNMGLNIRLKLNNDNAEAASYLNAIFKELKLSPVPPKGMVISSEDLALLEEAKKLNEKIITASIQKVYSNDAIDEAQHKGASAIYLDKEELLDCEEKQAKEYINSIKQKGLEIYVCVVNRKEAGQRLFELGVDGIFTDSPQNFSRYFP